MVFHYCCLFFDCFVNFIAFLMVSTRFLFYWMFLPNIVNVLFIGIFFCILIVFTMLLVANNDLFRNNHMFLVFKYVSNSRGVGKFEMFIVCCCCSHIINVPSYINMLFVLYENCTFVHAGRQPSLAHASTLVHTNIRAHTHTCIHTYLHSFIHSFLPIPTYIPTYISTYRHTAVHA